MKSKNYIIVLSVSLTLFLTIAFVAAWLIYNKFTSTLAPAMPNEVREVRTVVNNTSLTKKVFIEAPQVGRVTSIVFGELDPIPGPEIGIAGDKGALFTDRQANIKTSVQFILNPKKILSPSPSIMGEVEIIDVEGDHICEFLNRGSLHGASLIDHQGNVVWTYGNNTTLNDMAAGDVDGDGIAEFVAGYGGNHGLELLDRYAGKKWQQPDGNVWHVEVIRIDKAAPGRIVHSSVDGDITVRNDQGRLVSKSELPFYLGHFSLCKWPDKNSRQYALAAKEGRIWLFDFDGAILTQFEAPMSEESFEARGAPVKFKSADPEYLAVLLRFAGLPRSILYIYEKSGTLLYQEILPESCSSIAAVMLEDSNSETLLIGGDEKLWRYDLRH